MFQKLRRKGPKKILISKSLSNADIYTQSKVLFGKDARINVLSGTGYKMVTILKGLADYLYHPVPMHKCELCAVYLLALANRGVVFAINNHMSGEEIANKTLLNYKEKIAFSLDKHKWVSGILMGRGA